MNISVLGAGGWGTALAIVLAENGHRVALWGHDSAKCDIIRAQKENPRLPGVPLPDGLEITADIRCVNDCEVIVLATPSYAVRDTARKMAPYLGRGAVVVTASKGIEKDTSLTMTEIVEDELGAAHPVVALSGPSHAEEVGRGIPTAVVSASADQRAAELVQDIFMNPRFRVYTSDDVTGIELSAALKNVIALAAGCCDGMGLGDNTKAMLMTRGLAEIARLGEKMGGRKDTFAGLAGVGDLIVTCTSMHSRNRRCGILIGRGKTAGEAMKEVGAVVEGYYAAATAKTLADKLGVEMPISSAVYEVLYEKKDAKTVLHELMTRAKRKEVEESWL